MTPEQKAKLEALRLKTAEDLSDTEKAEVDLLVTIEKQAKQITEKDSLIGTKGTEIETLKKSIETSSGAAKTNLEEQLATKEEALAVMKDALDTVKEAHLITKAAHIISPKEPGHGDTVDPKEVEALEAKAQADPDTKVAVEELYKGLEPADKLAYKNDPAFRKLLLESVVDPEGDNTDDTPWANAAKKKEEDAETATQRMERLFNKEQGTHRRMPPNSSGRGGRGAGKPESMPKAAEREVDTRAQ